MRVLVCGGRNFNDAMYLIKSLDQAHMHGPITTLIHGCAQGADSLADLWAEKNQVQVERYRADWRKYGNGAGPIRNEQMLQQGKPQLVIAFTGGRGTNDMIRQARAAGVPVMKL